MKFRHEIVKDPGDSRHLADRCTPFHVIHGFLFTMGPWPIGLVSGGPLPLGTAFLPALGAECAWEGVENTDVAFERRATNIALDYYGGSVINSVMEIAAVIPGFRLARIWSARLTVVAALPMEAVVGFMIRDNLILNIIMLIRPLEAIDRRQAGSAG